MRSYLCCNWLFGLVDSTLFMQFSLECNLMILLLNSARFVGTVAEVSKYSVVFITYASLIMVLDIPYLTTREYGIPT